MSKTSFRPGVRDIRWIYKGAKWEIEVWAESRVEAAAILRQHGFLTVLVHDLIPGRTGHIVPTSVDFEKVNHERNR